MFHTRNIFREHSFENAPFSRQAATKENPHYFMWKTRAVFAKNAR